MKRTTDVVLSLLALTVTLPIILIFALAVWLQDGSAPFYVASRIGRGGRPFRILKLRSMVPDADRSGVDSTSADDARITRLGAFLRRWKLDELPQFLNVLKGEMSMVGPRPNVEREVRLYTAEERRLLDVRPGITDISSIVFSDLAAILLGSPDANIAYNQLVRPWKSRLGLLYVDRHSVPVDLRILALTALGTVNRPAALRGAARLVAHIGGDAELVAVARREQPLKPGVPPGAAAIVTSRD